jgi:hypothetical protein
MPPQPKHPNEPAEPTPDPSPVEAPAEKRPKSRWSLGKIVQQLKDDGVEVAVPVLDDGVLQGSLTFELNDERVLIVTYVGEPDSMPLNGFQAWATVRGGEVQ